MADIDTVVVHCSATPNGRDDRAEDIHRWHQERGWDGIGYHYVITVNGYIERGRPPYWRGAHVAGHNTGSIGVVLIGTDEFSDAQMRTLERLLGELEHDYGPGLEIVGHRDLDPGKTCPGFDAGAFAAKVLNRA